jgi:hypothetical protein
MTVLNAPREVCLHICGPRLVGQTVLPSVKHVHAIVEADNRDRLIGPKAMDASKRTDGSLYV